MTALADVVAAETPFPAGHPDRHRNLHQSRYGNTHLDDSSARPRILIGSQNDHFKTPFMMSAAQIAASQQTWYASKMTLANIVAGIALSVWGLMLFGGITAYRSVLDQHVEGFPNWGQFHLFLSLPGSIVAILLVGLALVNWKQRGAILLAVVSGGSFLFVLPWMTGFTGGV